MALHLRESLPSGSCQGEAAWQGQRHAPPRPPLARPLKNEERAAGHVGEAADHLIIGRWCRAFSLEGRDEFPPFLGMFIEQMLYMLERGTIVRGQLRDFVLTHSDHGRHPSMVVCARHGDPLS